MRSHRTRWQLGRCGTCCRCLLLLGIVAAAATAVPSQHKTLSYEEAVALAVDFYNQESGIDHAFRLLKADPQPEWDVSSKTIQSLKFTVKETVCPVSGNRNPNQCEFKEDGVRITLCTETPPSCSRSKQTRLRKAGQEGVLLSPGHRWVTWLAQGHTPGQWQSGEFNPSFSNLSPAL
uniref:Uncharacterized protein n=1 Tax=Gopherus evgoodei TaxID=1825980 RepID=A0A8C4WF57_9SAUR